MTPAEALAASTVNAAWVLGRHGRLGRLAAGYDGDLVLLEADDWRHLAYHLGGAVVRRTFKLGVRAVKELRRRLRELPVRRRGRRWRAWACCWWASRSPSRR